MTNIPTRSQPPHRAQERRHRETPAPPPKPPKRRRRAAQTGARRKGSGAFEQGQEGLVLPLPGVEILTVKNLAE